MAYKGKLPLRSSLPFPSILSIWCPLSRIATVESRASSWCSKPRDHAPHNVYPALIYGSPGFGNRLGDLIVTNIVAFVITSYLSDSSWLPNLQSYGSYSAFLLLVSSHAISKQLLDHKAEKQLRSVRSRRLSHTQDTSVG